MAYSQEHLSKHLDQNPTPPPTDEHEQYNYDDIWTLIREKKIKQLALQPPLIRMEADHRTAYTGETTTAQAAIAKCLLRIDSSFSPLLASP